MVVAPSLVEERLELLLERAVVAEPGQPVHEREVAGLLVGPVEARPGLLELGGRLEDLVGHPPRQDDEQGPDPGERRQVDRLQPVGPTGEDPEQRRPERHREDGGRGEHQVEAQADEPERIARRLGARRDGPCGG